MWTTEWRRESYISDLYEKSALTHSDNINLEVNSILHFADSAPILLMLFDLAAQLHKLDFFFMVNAIYKCISLLQFTVIIEDSNTWALKE